LPDLRRTITDAVASVTPEVLRNTWTESECSLDVCRTTWGSTQRFIDITVSLVTLLVFRYKPLVLILIANRVIRSLFGLLSFRTLCRRVIKLLKSQALRQGRKRITDSFKCLKSNKAIMKNIRV
jgi:hypothetical protein